MERVILRCRVHIHLDLTNVTFSVYEQDYKLFPRNNKTIVELGGDRIVSFDHPQIDIRVGSIVFYMRGDHVEIDRDPYTSYLVPSLRHITSQEVYTILFSLCAVLVGDVNKLKMNINNAGCTIYLIEE